MNTKNTWNDSQGFLLWQGLINSSYNTQWFLEIVRIWDGDVDDLCSWNEEEEKLKKERKQ